MNISIISVSYMNDYMDHAEWLHPFFASLEVELSKVSGWEVNHHIFLNDDDPSSAEENIKRVFHCYDFKNYTLNFFEMGDFTHYPGCGNHHGRALEIGLQKLSDSNDTLSDFYLIEEFDIIHKDNYMKRLKSLIDFSLEFDAFFGKVRENFSKIHNDLSSSKKVLNITFSRVLPHFLGIPNSLFLDFTGECDYLFSSRDGNDFDKKVSDLNLKSNSFDVITESDTGADLFRLVFPDKPFFNIGYYSPVNHISGVTGCFMRIRDTKYGSENHDLNHLLESLSYGFKTVKEERDLNFPDDCIFSSEDYRLDLLKF